VFFTGQINGLEPSLKKAAYSGVSFVKVHRITRSKLLHEFHYSIIFNLS